MQLSCYRAVALLVLHANAKAAVLHACTCMCCCHHQPLMMRLHVLQQLLLFCYVLSGPCYMQQFVLLPVLQEPEHSYCRQNAVFPCMCCCHCVVAIVVLLLLLLYTCCCCAAGVAIEHLLHSQAYAAATAQSLLGCSYKSLHCYFRRCKAAVCAQ